MNNQELTIEDLYNLDTLEYAYRTYVPTFASELDRAKTKKSTTKIAKIGIVYEVFSDCSGKYIGSTISTYDMTIDSLLRRRYQNWGQQPYAFDVDKNIGLRPLLIYYNQPIWVTRVAEAVVMRYFNDITTLLNNDYDFTFRSELFCATGENSFQNTVGSGKFDGEDNPSWGDYSRHNWSHPNAKIVTSMIKIQEHECLEFTNAYIASKFFGIHRSKTPYVIRANSSLHVRRFDRTHQFMTEYGDKMTIQVNSPSGYRLTTEDGIIISKGVITKCYDALISASNIPYGEYLGFHSVNKTETYESVKAEIQHIENTIRYHMRKTPSRMI